ncbi:uncharacterized protein BXZ73DRAFT_105264 [Epithele typhae]|uniref:uncharacterized protein n=1 Tax=Epithele typhae TaxID=378194 RepID=UPI00200743C6|nr:uncharacterized protein BXZ73DRAFT_105264 [Epithele typhae]KAH9918386.1 hypothetical protein BXZ73DRAFT_105264 [Epithele typhae]
MDIRLLLRDDTEPSPSSPSPSSSSDPTPGPTPSVALPSGQSVLEERPPPSEWPASGLYVPKRVRPLDDILLDPERYHKASQFYEEKAAPDGLLVVPLEVPLDLPPRHKDFPPAPFWPEKPLGRLPGSTVPATEWECEVRFTKPWLHEVAGQMEKAKRVLGKDRHEITPEVFVLNYVVLPDGHEEGSLLPPMSALGPFQEAELRQGPPMREIDMQYLPPDFIPNPIPYMERPLEVPGGKPVLLKRVEGDTYSNPYGPSRIAATMKLDANAQRVYENREHMWMRTLDGSIIPQVRDRVFGLAVGGIQERQQKAAAAWREEEAWAKAKREAEVVGAEPEDRDPLGIMDGLDEGEDVDHRFDVEFKTADGEQGLSMKLLMSGRRVMARAMKGHKDKVFDGYPRESWPAYPDHELIRCILATKNTSRKRVPITRLEFAVALTSALTQYYKEVSDMEPHPAFRHRALGPDGGRLSLFALRVMGVTAASITGVYDLQMELDGIQSAPPEPPVTPLPSSSSMSPPQEVDAVELANSGSAPVSPIPGPSNIPSPSPAPPTDNIEPPEPPARAITPPWASTLPVECTVGPVPEPTARDFLAHVDYHASRSIPLPAWPTSTHAPRELWPPDVRPKWFPWEAGKIHWW